MYYNQHLSRDNKDSIFNGTQDNGEFHFDDGCGNSMAMKWNPSSLVWVAFDHESERSHFDPQYQGFDDGEGPVDNPDFFFDDYPEEHKTLLVDCAKLLDRTGWNNVTATLWSDTSGTLYVPEEFDVAEEHGLWMLESYFLTPEEAFFDAGSSMSWSEKYSLNRSECEKLLKG